MPQLTFIGTGEAFDPELPNTSVLYRGARALLVDCGYSIPQAFWAHTRDPSLLDAVYLTHLHADHCFGLPALLVWMRGAGRSRPLTLLGGPGSTGWIRDVLERGYPGAYDPSKCFPIEYAEVPVGNDFVWGPLRLRSARSEHSVDNHALRIEEDGVVYCHSGDGAPSPESRDLYRGADLLVHECYGVEGKHAHHADATSLFTLADELGLSRLCLVHIEADPETKRAVASAAMARSAGAHVLVPAPGDKIAL